MKTKAIVTHNVLVTLPDHIAGQVLGVLLGLCPQILGLQEWGRGRRRVLDRRARPVRFSRFRRRVLRHPYAGYAYAYPRRGGQPLIVDTNYGRFVKVRRIKLSRRRRGVRATHGTEGTIRELGTGQLVEVLDIHPPAHHDRPANAAAWMEAIETVEAWLLAGEGERYVLGDINNALMRIGDLQSCWLGRRPKSGTGPGGGLIDHIYGKDKALEAYRVKTESDHWAVLAVYPEKSPQ